MSETHSTLFNKRSYYLLIVGAFVLLFIVFVVRILSPSPPDPEPVTVQTAETQQRRVQSSPPVFEVSEAYYSTIIDNNLFRPLGWTPPRPVEPYRLLGTILPTDDNTPPRAIIQSTTGNTTHIVTTGERIDSHTEVVSIQHKQVVLETDGKQSTLRLSVRF